MVARPSSNRIRDSIHSGVPPVPVRDAVSDHVRNVNVHAHLQCVAMASVLLRVVDALRSHCVLQMVQQEC